MKCLGHTELAGVTTCNEGGGRDVADIIFVVRGRPSDQGADVQSCTTKRAVFRLTRSHGRRSTCPVPGARCRREAPSLPLLPALGEARICDSEMQNEASSSPSRRVSVGRAKAASRWPSWHGRGLHARLALASSHVLQRLSAASEQMLRAAGSSAGVDSGATSGRCGDAYRCRLDAGLG